MQDSEDRYQALGYFYDSIIGDRRDEIRYLKKLIREFAPKARDLLEIGCGTGEILKSLHGKYAVSGIDISETMLSQAQQKLPKASLYQMDMRNFHLGAAFDVVLCVYDSINHLSSLSDWKKTFSSVRKHLNPGGVLIFDMNTLYKLEALAKEPPTVHDFDESTYIFDVEKRGKNRFDWSARVFIPTEEVGVYSSIEEIIPETAFSLSVVENALKPYFRVVAVRDMTKKRRSATSERLYLVCRALE